MCVVRVCKREQKSKFTCQNKNCLYARSESLILIMVNPDRRMATGFSNLICRFFYKARKKK